MIQRIQTLWMALTAALMCVVFFTPVVYFSLAGAEFRIMAYGIKEVAGQMLIFQGEEMVQQFPQLWICVSILIGVSALVPLVAIFCYRKRMVQVRLLSAEFILLLGSAGMLAWYVYKVHDIVAAMSTNFYFSFYPLLIVVALLTNWFAVRGVIRDEVLVRSVDRIR